MRKHKNKWIAAAVIVAVLAAAWFMGGGAKPVPPEQSTAQTTESFAPATNAPGQSATPVPSVLAAQTLAPSATEDAATDTPSATPEPTATAEPSAEPTAAPAETEPPAQSTDPETGADAYNTDPVPSGKPVPVEPQDVTVGDGSFTVTLTIRCDTLLANMDALDANKRELVPADGIVFPTTAVTAYEGESVFNILQRETRRNKLHLEFASTPLYNSAYIEGIHNLYEFDCGGLSGWMYTVNGWFPNYGCSRYQLQPGDVVEWIYTCDLGRDIGGGDVMQKDE